MKAAIAAIAIFISLVLGGAAFMVSDVFESHPTKQEIRTLARASSVQLAFHFPVLHAYFAEPLKDKEQVTVALLDKIFDEKIELIQKEIQEAILKERKWQSKERYSTYPTEIDAWIESPSRTSIPLGMMVPDHAKWLKNVLIVAEVEKEEIDPYDKEYKDDVRSISETANVSLPKAKEILSRIKASGYTISKEEIKKSTDVKLLHLSDWTTNYPTILKWEVTVEGEPDINIILGYDPYRGILEVRPIPKDRRVRVIASYYDLKDEFKVKPDEVNALEREKKELQERLDRLQKEKDELGKKYYKATHEKSDTKRNIGKATWADVKYGRVKVEEFWMVGAATGLYLGNTEVSSQGIEGRDKTWQGWRKAGRYSTEKTKGTAGVILTNAHVAHQAIDFKVYISKDLEHIWLVWPGKPYARYTADSDHFGAPAYVYNIDGENVISWDFDSALMLTSPVVGMEKNRAILGDSDKIETGQKMMVVGNPSLVQKFTSEGVITNKKYSLWQSIYTANWFPEIKNKPQYNYIKNATLWFDAMAHGGNSGSGIWMTEGSQKGTVVGLLNMGLTRPLAFAPIKKRSISLANETKNIKLIDTPAGSFFVGNELAKPTKEYMLKFFEQHPVEKAEYSMAYEHFLLDYPTFKIVTEEMAYVAMAGMTAAIPINHIKRFLQERGIDPRQFNWGKELDTNYFAK